MGIVYDPSKDFVYYSLILGVLMRFNPRPWLSSTLALPL
jgi:hypothetical protein